MIIDCVSYILISMWGGEDCVLWFIMMKPVTQIITKSSLRVRHMTTLSDIPVMLTRACALRTAATLNIVLITNVIDGRILNVSMTRIVYGG